jgi:MtN3 and saliva related transmembrane protein
MVLLIVGLIASITSTISLLPQLYQTYRTKSVGDLSMLMLVNFAVCSISWVIYGLLTDTTSVWVTNVIMTFCSIALVTMKYKYQPTKEP